MVDPRKMENPRWDHLFSVLWGPLTNVIIAVGIAFIFRIVVAVGLPIPGLFMQFVEFGVFINLALAVFNMLPIGPLDGHWILGILMPPEIGYKFMHWSQRQGSLILLAVIFIGPYFNFRPIQSLFFSIVYPAGNFLLGI
jgi:Zn-dependent protease